MNPNLTLAQVVTLVGFPSVQTYIANRPALFAELAAGGHKGERLAADQFGNQLAGHDTAAVTPLVPVVASTPAP